MYTSIIFDFFDVIRSDPYKAWLARYNIKREGEFDAASNLLDRGEISLDEFFEKLHKLSGHSTETLVKEYNNTVLMNESMPDFIKQLREHYKVGLLSNAPSDYLRGLLLENDYEKLFDVVVISSEVGLIKPTAEAFHHILAKLGSKAEETIFIDDYEHNVRAADKLGIKGVLYTNLDRLKSDLGGLGLQIT